MIVSDGGEALEKLRKDFSEIKDDVRWLKERIEEDLARVEGLPFEGVTVFAPSSRIP